MIIQTVEITTVNVLLEELNGFFGSIILHPHIVAWFRGQSDSNWELHPAVCRSGFSVSTTKWEKFAKEQQLYQDFRVNSAQLLQGPASDEELYFLQQHYRMPTRLLDWTLSPLTALYFAVEEDKNNKAGTDGALFMMNAYALAMDQKLGDKKVYDHNDGFKGAPTSRLPKFVKAVKLISGWGHLEDFPDYIIPVRPHFTDKRIVLQNSVFTFHTPKHEALTQSHNSTLRKYIIPKDSKEPIRKQLEFLGFNDFKTYGDMESLARTLVKAHKDT